MPFWKRLTAVRSSPIPPNLILVRGFGAEEVADEVVPAAAHPVVALPEAVTHDVSTSASNVSIEKQQVPSRRCQYGRSTNAVNTDSNHSI